MAQRDKLPIELIWVLVDLGLPQVNALINVAENRHKNKAPGTELSVNRNVAGTQALIKIAEGETGFRNALSGAARNAIVRVYTEVDHPEALALVTAPGWEPAEEAASELLSLPLDTGAIEVAGEELDAKKSKEP